MSMFINPADRSPKGDHNRRLSLGLDPDQFAYAAGITVDELRQYETTGPDHEFSVMIAGRIGDALDRLETILPNSEAAGQHPDYDISKSEAIAEVTDESFDERVRKVAYSMWEEDGRPQGRDDEYLLRAREACLGEEVLDDGFTEAMGDADPIHPGSQHWR